MDRKKFLSLSALTALSVSSIGSVLAKADRFTGDCQTTSDILGPFYRKDAPIRQSLMDKGVAGNRVEIKGKVFGSDCTTPIEKAQVEIWHCDTEGEYDNHSKAYKHRGQWITNEGGNYAFQTILPGKYLNGELYRPAHIHFRVTAPGFKELVSQVYFQGDPHIDKDPWASKKEAEQRILPIVLEDTSGNLVVELNIYLAESN